MNETITISAQYTDTIENLTFFAIEKGWTPTVFQDVEIEKENEEGEKYTAIENKEVPNPITLSIFLTSWAREYLLGGISQPIIQAIERQSQEQLVTLKQGYFEKLENNLQVNTE